MNSKLQIVRAKPNPAGKDKYRSGAPKPEQLVAEWVDIKNIGTEAVPFSTMGLHHTLFDERCVTQNKTECYWSNGGSKALEPGGVLRVHTGRKEYENTLSAEDRSPGWSAFAGLDRFVLNNRCGDRLYITWTRLGQQDQDGAHYEPNPPEGVVLHRRGAKLEPALVGAY